ncbi:MAG: AarF/ABC1/UbiB kinase family protein [Deltaproteobacteria bacterium]|nr:AarF/ABC1/UbiB kinase family protein [Deltaproteobacteria bacterium]RLA90511.1 MAG: AarF/ABC1/UbiB kinase family protein [Deltaproteobacteria bacterium]
MFIRKIGTIGRTYRHVQRYRQILTILFKYGFGDLIDTLKIDQYLEIGWQMISKKRREKVETLTRAERVRMALEELGPTFIKLGQILSTRPDLVPVNFLQELVKLQDNVPPFDYNDVKLIVETELESPIRKIFKDFEESPLAAASIGQVHRAKLIDGEEVVVKVQRPNIRRIVEVDLEIMLHLATLMERHLEGFELHQPTKIVEEFARAIEKELDYTIEASHLERFGNQFLGDPTIYVPKVYIDETTTRVLTMEYIDGIKSYELNQLKQKGFDLKEIASRGADLLMKQIFIYGFFHADPHPGNIFILPNNVICYLDFGIMGRINRKTREDFANLFLAIVQKDEAKVVDALLRLTIWDDEPNSNLLERDVADLIDQHFYKPLKYLKFGKLIYQLQELIARYHLTIPQDLFLMLKAIATMEDLGRKLDPNFDITKHAAPFLKQIQFERFYPQRIASDMFDSGTDLIYLMREIPKDLRDILAKLNRGKLKIGFEHKGLDPMLATHDRIVNRIAFAIVLASLIIGSSLIVLSGIPPKWYEIPIIGLAGFIVAGLMGFKLLISILKRGKM